MISVPNHIKAWQKLSCLAAGWPFCDLAACPMVPEEYRESEVARDVKEALARDRKPVPCATDARIVLPCPSCRAGVSIMPGPWAEVLPECQATYISQVEIQRHTLRQEIEAAGGLDVWRKERSARFRSLVEKVLKPLPSGRTAGKSS